MASLSPLARFRDRSLSFSPVVFTTGWENVLVPYGLAHTGRIVEDAALIDWAMTWFEHHDEAGYREAAIAPDVLSKDGQRGHFIGDYCGNWGGLLVFAELCRVKKAPRLLEATRTICDALLRRRRV